MAIIFHEGLPGSGKSYEAIRTICLKLGKGRPVCAYMEGLDNQAIADFLGKPVEYVDELLTKISRDDVKQIFTHTKKDQFVVIDEIQNFWPATRERLPDDLVQFVTEHRHLGQDILIMGQDHRDTHNLWKRRIDKKMSFLKLDALGASGRYRWSAEQQIGGRWSKIGGKTEKYDVAYFGLYQSHVTGVDNQATYQDTRFSVWRSPVFRYVLPGVFALCVFAVYHLVGFFSPVVPVDVVQPVDSSPPVSVVRSAMKPLVAGSTPVAPLVPVEPVEVVEEPPTFVGDLVSRYRPRVSGVIESQRGLYGFVEFFDGSFRLRERLSIEGIRDLGWDVRVMSYGLEIVKDDEKFIVTSWPVEPFGAVSQKTLDDPALNANEGLPLTASELYQAPAGSSERF